MSQTPQDQPSWAPPPSSQQPWVTPAPSGYATPPPPPPPPTPAPYSPYLGQPAWGTDRGASPVPALGSDERMWATIVHLSPFLGVTVGMPFLGPLILFLIFRNRSEFVRRHSVEALNFQLTFLLSFVFSVFVMGMLFATFTPMLVLLAIFLVAGLVIVAAILHIVAAAAANRGDSFRYVVSFPFVR